MTNAGGVEREHEGQRELRTVVALQLSNRERHRRLDLAEEVEARVLIEPRIQDGARASVCNRPVSCTGSTASRWSFTL
jgi:hypothetical protein